MMPDLFSSTTIPALGEVLNFAQARHTVLTGNIANVNTVAFKSSRALFKPQFYITDGAGSGPDGDFGGTNPDQRGLGAQIAAAGHKYSHSGKSAIIGGPASDPARRRARGLPRGCMIQKLPWITRLLQSKMSVISSTSNATHWLCWRVESLFPSEVRPYSQPRS